MTSNLAVASVGTATADERFPPVRRRRHRAPEPSSWDAPDDTVVVVAGWAEYGRHAAPAPEAWLGRPRPAPPRRPGTAVVARGDVSGQRQADAAPAPAVAVGPDGGAPPGPGAATGRGDGFIRRCLDYWRTRRVA